MNISFVNIEIGKLGGFVATETAVVANPLVFSPHMSLQTMGREAFVATLGTFELDVLVPGFDVSLQMGRLGGGVVTGRTFVNDSFMDRLYVSFEVECGCSFKLAALFWTNQPETFMGDFDMLFELSFLLARVIALITIVTQSLMLSLNVDIKLELSLGRKITIWTLEGNVIVDSLYVTVQTALALQLQPTVGTVKPETLMRRSHVMLQGGLCLTGVGTVPYLTPVGFQLMGVSDVLPEDPGVRGLKLAAVHGTFKSLPLKLVVGDHVFVESALGGTFIVTLSTVHGDLQMFEVFMFLQNPWSGGGKAAEVAAMQDVLMDCREVSPERALVRELFAALRALLPHQTVDCPQVPQEVGSPGGHVVALLAPDLVLLPTRLRLLAEFQLVGVEDLLSVIWPAKLVLGVEIFQTILWTGLDITELVLNIGKRLLDVNIDFHLQ